MSDTASDSHSARSSVGDHRQAKKVRESGDPGHEGGSPLADQPTVISGRPPLPASVPPKPPEDLQPGDLPPSARLGHFELLEYIGGGGMGRVFRALDTRLGRTVALKVLSREQVVDMDTLMRFRNEAQSAARLNHEGIAQVYYLGEDDGFPFIAFEFVQGVNVRDLVADKGPLPLAKALSYTLQAAEALAHAASRNVVHRDIKPSNVLITPEGRVKLIDMGLARMQKTSASANELTASGVTLGTFDYISPEQARDPRNADLRSDIYSLGCTLFYMLTGGPPFPEGTVLQKLLQHQGIDPPDVRQFRPHLPEEVSRILRKMMAKEPRHRYQDASRLIDALLLLAEQIGLRLLGPGHTKWIALEEAKRSFLRRHVPWMAPVAALLVIVPLLQTLWAGAAQDDGQLPTWGDPLEESVEQPLVSEAPTPSAEGMPRLERTDDSPSLKPPAESPAYGSPAVPSTRLDDVAVPTEKPSSAGANGQAAEAVALPQAKTGVEGAVEPLPTMTARPSDETLIGLETPEPSAGGPGQSETGPDSKPQAELDQQGTNKTVAATQQPPGVDPASQPASKPTGILVVDPGGKALEGFATLAEACKVAGLGDVIELHFDGPLESEPITLTDVELTLRAGSGFRPVLRFGPSEIDPASSPRSMFTLIGSRLTLLDVAVELDIPRGVPSERWALFGVGAGQEVKLAGCWLTIRNASGQRMAYHQQVAFFRVRPPGAEPALQETPVDGAGILAIELTDCVVRGEAVFLRTTGPGPVSLVWTNGLLVTTEQLLVASGIEEPAQANDMIRIDLNHLAAVVDGGLCRWVSSEMGPHQLPARIECANSVVVGTAKACLIEQVGVTDKEQSLEWIQWVGNRNTYEGFSSFWTTRYLDPETLPEVRDFDAWRTWWGEQNEFAPTMRLTGENPRPGRERPVHSLTPKDYAWAGAAAGQEPVAEAGSTQETGFQPNRLPPAPNPAARLPWPQNPPD